MRIIYKYELPFRAGEIQDGEVSAQIPKDAVLLKCYIQVIVTTLVLYVWALVDTSAEKEEKRFRVHGTGYTLPNDSVAVNADSGEFEYWDTVFGRDVIWHVFVSVS